MDIRCNDFLVVLWEGGEYPARVKELGSGEREGEFYVHYVNSGKGYDEWVGLDRVVRGVPMASVRGFKGISVSERERLATLVACTGGCGGYFPPENLGVEMLGMPEIRKEGAKCRACVALTVPERQAGCADERETTQLNCIPAVGHDGLDTSESSTELEQCEEDEVGLDVKEIHRGQVLTDVVADGCEVGAGDGSVGGMVDGGGEGG